MEHCSQVWLLCLVTLLVANLSLPKSQARASCGNDIKSGVFLTPKFELRPGSVADKFYYDIDFPKGHIALKSFNAEVVDEAGNSIPLHETYLHHWVVVRYYQRSGVENPKYHWNMGFQQTDMIALPNSGPCQHNLGQYFGLGSETRKTETRVPDPYGIEIGNPAEIPPGYEEKWIMNVHAIDTRGVEDRLGCTECWCDLYNVTKDENGQPLKPGYKGGLHCCHDQAQCRLREGFESAKRGLYVKYTVTWVDWDTSVVPVKIYIFDVTDTWKRSDDSPGSTPKHHCLIEYGVESCSANGVTNDGCIDTKRVSLTMQTGGSVVYGVAHQHTGGVGSTLYGEDGRIICSSLPIYGEGKEVGNEAGYIVGMSTCYPHPGSVRISDGETLVLESTYSSSRGQGHIGVMGLFYILVANEPQDPISVLHAPVEKHETMTLSISLLGGVALFGVVTVAIASFVAYRRSDREDGYQSIVL